MKNTKSTSLKICGITQIDQAKEIASIGVEAIGVIAVKNSPRFLEEQLRRELFSELKNCSPSTQRVLVVADIDELEIDRAVNCHGAPSIIQLHGRESPEECLFYRQKYPQIKWWKAIRARNETDLLLADTYKESVDALLIDAWNKNELGGTGQRIPRELLRQISFNIPWWVAGGISIECIEEILKEVKPFGVDASSKLEISPGIKNLENIKLLYNKIKKIHKHKE